MSDEPFSPLLLSSNRINCSVEQPKGWLTALSPDEIPRGIPDQLQNHTNSIGKVYEENHLEEWVSRSPRALFPEEEAEIIASQNYAHLPEKVDLLFVVPGPRFYVTEAKIETVSKNNGVVPYKICDVQMKGYVDFLQSYLADYPASHERYYARFSQRFWGTARKLPEYACDRAGEKPVDLVEVYLAEGYDNYALAYFSEKRKVERRAMKLIHYRFFPESNIVQFWELVPTEN